MNDTKLCFALALSVLGLALCLGQPRRSGTAAEPAPATVAQPPAPPAHLPPAIPARVPAEAGAVAAPAVLASEPRVPAGEPGDAPSPSRDVGPCPLAHLPPVVRRGVDALGRPTWWHADGSFTLRAVQRIKAPDGSFRELPVVLHAVPGDRRVR